MVNSTPDFAEHPKVINGYSELMKDISATRRRNPSAVGNGWSAGGIAVEIEAVFQVKD